MCLVNYNEMCSVYVLDLATVYYICHNIIYKKMWRYSFKGLENAKQG